MPDNNNFHLRYDDDEDDNMKSESKKRTNRVTMVWAAFLHVFILKLKYMNTSSLDYAKRANHTHYTSKAFKKISCIYNATVSFHINFFTGIPKTVYNNRKPTQMDQDERKKRKYNCTTGRKKWEKKKSATNKSVRIHIFRRLIL